MRWSEKRFFTLPCKARRGIIQFFAGETDLMERFSLGWAASFYILVL